MRFSTLDLFIPARIFQSAWEFAQAVYLFWEDHNQKRPILYSLVGFFVQNRRVSVVDGFHFGGLRILSLPFAVFVGFIEWWAPTCTEAVHCSPMWSGGMKGHPRPRPWFSARKGWRTQSGSRTSHYPRWCSSSILGSFSQIWGEWSMRLTNGLGQHQWCGKCTFLSKHSFQTPWCCTSSTLKSHLLLLSSFTASEGVSQCPQYCAVFSVNLIILYGSFSTGVRFSHVGILTFFPCFFMVSKSCHWNNRRSLWG